MGNNNDYLNIVKVTKTRFGIAGYTVRDENEKNAVLQNGITKKAWSQVLAKRKLLLTKAGPEFLNRAQEAASRSGNDQLFAEIEQVSNNEQVDQLEKETEITNVVEENNDKSVIDDKEETNSTVGIKKLKIQMKYLH